MAIAVEAPRELLEPIIRFIKLEQDTKPLVIPAILPPSVSLGPEKVAPGQINPEKIIGSVRITIRNEAGRAQAFHGRITHYDEEKGDVEFSIGNGHGSYAYVRQENGMSEIWCDISDAVSRKETTLDRDHPVFAYIIRSVGGFSLETGKGGESQAYANLGAVDFWGFLRGRRASAGSRIALVDNAA